MVINRHPFNPLGIDSAKNQLLAFALTVRTASDHQRRLWSGNGISTWLVFEAGSTDLKG